MLRIKQIIVSILTGTIGYKILRFVNGENIKINRCFYALNELLANKYIKVLIHLGSYEKSELRFINTMSTLNVPIVEFGLSVGVITSQIASSIRQQVAGFQGNPTLITAIESNLSCNHLSNVRIRYLHFNR